MESKCKSCLIGTALWSGLVVVVLSLGFGIGSGKFGEESTRMRSSDMHYLTKGLSTVFCSGVDVSALDGTLDVYMLPHRPRIDPESCQIYTTKFKNTVEGRYYQSYQYYLLEGSIVSLNSSCDTQLEMYVFQGYENFNSFINNKVCDKCYSYHDTVRKHSHYTLNTTATDDYYFVYVNNNFLSEKLVVDVFLNRTLYDVQNIIPCLYREEEPCHFDFQLASDESIVVQLRDSNGNGTYAALVMSACVARVWLYVLAFVVGALALGSIYPVLHALSPTVQGQRSYEDFACPDHNCHYPVNHSSW
jgi:hypothetical protein